MAKAGERDEGKIKNGLERAEFVKKGMSGRRRRQRIFANRNLEIEAL